MNIRTTIKKRAVENTVTFKPHQNTPPQTHKKGRPGGLKWVREPCSHFGPSVIFNDKLGASRGGSICGLMGCPGLGPSSKKQVSKVQIQQSKRAAKTFERIQIPKSADEISNTFKHRQNTFVQNHEKHAGLEAQMSL